MAYKLLPRLLNFSAFGTVLALGICLPSFAQSSGTEFVCARDEDGTYITVVRRPELSEPESVIQWTLPLGNNTPEERCRIISRRFQVYMVQRRMNHITLGNQGGLPVICAASVADEAAGCEAVLFTVRNWEEADRIRKQLENIGLGFVQGTILQGGQQTFYFNLIDYLSDPSSQEDAVFPLTQ